MIRKREDKIVWYENIGLENRIIFIVRGVLKSKAHQHGQHHNCVGEVLIVMPSLGEFWV